MKSGPRRKHSGEENKRGLRNGANLGRSFNGSQGRTIHLERKIHRRGEIGYYRDLSDGPFNPQEEVSQAGKKIVGTLLGNKIKLDANGQSTGLFLPCELQGGKKFWGKEGGMGGENWGKNRERGDREGINSASCYAQRSTLLAKISMVRGESWG